MGVIRTRVAMHDIDNGSKLDKFGGIDMTTTFVPKLAGYSNHEKINVAGEDEIIVVAECGDTTHIRYVSAQGDGLGTDWQTTDDAGLEHAPRMSDRARSIVEDRL